MGNKIIGERAVKQRMRWEQRVTQCPFIQCERGCSAIHRGSVADSLHIGKCFIQIACPAARTRAMTGVDGHRCAHPSGKVARQIENARLPAVVVVGHDRLELAQVWGCSWVGCGGVWGGGGGGGSGGRGGTYSCWRRARGA